MADALVRASVISKVRDLQKVAGDLLTLDLGKTNIVGWMFTMNTARTRETSS
jgi:hypothetical protein